MEILKVCIDEIALSGLEGCTFAELCELVARRQPPVAFPLDEQTKQFIWSQLIQRGTIVRLYKLPEPRKVVETLRPLGAAQGVEYVHPYPYRLVSDENQPVRVRGSCSTYEQRRDVTEDIAKEGLSLSAAIEKYGNGLVLVASQEVRERALTPAEMDPMLDLSEVQYCVLEVIGCSREYGILRSYITNHFLRIDARSTFHHVKTLAAMNLVVIREGRQLKSGRVSSVFNLTLSRFSPLDTLYDDTMQVYESQFCRLLEAAPFRALPVGNLKNTLGKGYKHARVSLLKRGIIVRVGASELTGEEDCEAMEQVKGYRLVKPYTVEQPLEEGEEAGQAAGDEDDEDGVAFDPSRLTPIVFELPLDIQGYRLIEGHGPEGMSNPEFVHQGLKVHNKLNRQLVKYLLKSSVVSGIVTDISSNRVVRLVATDLLAQNEDYQDLLTETAKTGLSQDVSLYKMNRNNQTKPKKKKKSAKKTPPIPPPSEGGRGNDETVPADAQREEGAVGVASGSSLLVQEEGREELPGPIPPPHPPPPHPAVPDDGVVGPLSGQSPLQDTTSTVSHRRVVTQVTSKRLKRFNHIRDYLETRHVVKGTADLAKHLKQFEPGDFQVHMKTVTSLLRQMELKGMVTHKDVIVTMGDRTNKSTLYYIPGLASEEELSKAEHHYLETMKGSMLPRVKMEKQKRGRKRKREKRRQQESDEEDEEEEGEEDMGEESEGLEDEDKSSEDENMEFKVTDFTPCSSQVRASKYQRIKLLHYYMWLLTYGDEQVSEQSRDPTPSVRTKKNPCGLSAVTFPWVESVSKVTCIRGPGWVSFLDILSHMPLTLFVLLVGVYTKMVKKKYHCYFSHPELRNTIFNQLPLGLRKHLCHLRRDKRELSFLLTQMAEMGLLEVDGHITFSKTVAGVYLRLQHEGTILDTSTADPRRSFFMEEARSLFEVLRFPFTSVADLERFWFELQRVCQYTRIILVDRSSKKRTSDQEDSSGEDGEEEEGAQTYSKDIFPLPYTTKEKMKMRKQHTAMKDARGFGAGGLPPHSFSHLYRNWCPPRTTTAVGLESADMLARGGGASNDSYGPGVGLTQLPSAKMARRGRDRDEAGEEGTPGGLLELDNIVKGLKPMSTPTPFKVKGPFAKLTIKSSEVLRRHGGKGLKRVEQAKKLEATRRVKKAKETVVRMRHGTHKKPLRVEKQASSGHRMRTNWHSQEDTVLMLAYIAAKIMLQRKTDDHAPSEVGVATEQQAEILPLIMEAHRQEFPDTKKTPSVVYRRLLNMLRNESRMTTIDVCVAEVMEDMHRHGPSSNPQTTFSSALQYVKEKYRSQGNSFLSPHVSLPATMAELERDYIVAEYGSKSLAPMDMDEQITIAQLCDLIIAALGADKDSYDDYAAYKLFEHFTKADTKAAFDVLKAHNLLKQKRSTKGIPREKGPLPTQSYSLTSSFYSRFEANNLFKAVASLLKILQSHSWPGDRTQVPTQLSPRPPAEDSPVAMETSKECGEEEGGVRVVPDTPFHGVSVVGDGCVEVDSGKATGSIFTALIGVLFGSSRDSSVLSCEATFPKQLLVEKEGVSKPQPPEHPKEQQCPTSLLDEEEDEEDDQSQEEGEEEEGEEGEGVGVGKRIGMVKASCGIATFLNVSEVTALGHCTVQLEVVPSVGPLCRPLDGEELPRPPHPTTPTSEARVGHMPLSCYLELCGAELKFPESDVVFASKLYDVIDACGSKGISLGTLREHEQLSSLEHSLSVADHITFLLNFEMIYKVGISSEIYVTHTHLRRWFMPSEQHGCASTGVVAYRPWATIQQPDPNMRLLRGYQDGVLNYITAHPGITMSSLASHFAGMMRLNGLREILQVLEASGCIRSYSFSPPPPSRCTLFSEPLPPCIIGVPSPDTLPDYVFYHATPTASIIWAGSLNHPSP